jgi:hypothetical protein
MQLISRCASELYIDGNHLYASRLRCPVTRLPHTSLQVLSIKRPPEAPTLLKKATDAPKLLKRLVASSVATTVGTQKYNLVPTCRDFAV